MLRFLNWECVWQLRHFICGHNMFNLLTWLLPNWHYHDYFMTVSWLSAWFPAYVQTSYCILSTAYFSCPSLMSPISTLQWYGAAFDILGTRYIWQPRGTRIPIQSCLPLTYPLTAACYVTAVGCHQSAKSQVLINPILRINYIPCSMLFRALEWNVP